MKYILIICLSIVLIYQGIFVNSQCPIFSSNELNYDFNQLTLTDGSSYTIETNSGQYKFYINVCAPSKICEQQIPNSVSCINDVDAQAWDSNGKFDSFTGFKPLDDSTLKGGSIVYSNPDSGYCFETENVRTTQIDLICSDDETPIVSSIVQNPKCYYTFTIKSKLACPVVPNEPITTVTSEKINGVTISRIITTRKIPSGYSVLNVTSATDSERTITSIESSILTNNNQTVKYMNTISTIEDINIKSKTIQ